MADMILTQAVAWGEEYVSRALNQKFGGILAPGVYAGFVVSPGTGMEVSISNDADYPYSVACVDREGYNITVRAVSPGTIVIPSFAGTYYVCVDAYYAPNQTGYQRVIVTTSPESYHVVLATVTVPAGTTQITAAMLSENGRMVGNPIEWLITCTAKLVEVQTKNLNLTARIGNLEQWAKQQVSAYNPDTTYSPSGNS